MNKIQKNPIKYKILSDIIGRKYSKCKEKTKKTLLVFDDKKIHKDFKTNYIGNHIENCNLNKNKMYNAY